MHSLVVMKRDEYYTKDEITKGIYLTKGGVWDIWNEEDLYFGRLPFRTLNTFKDKWMYACASLVKEYKDDVFKELESIAYKYIPNLTAIMLPKFVEYIPKIEKGIVYSDVYTLKYGKTEEEMEKFILEKEEKWLNYWKETKQEEVKTEEQEKSKEEINEEVNKEKSEECEAKESEENKETESENNEEEKEIEEVETEEKLDGDKTEPEKEDKAEEENK